jgi:hypothetical protein
MKRLQRNLCMRTLRAQIPRRFKSQARRAGGELSGVFIQMAFMDGNLQSRLLQRACRGGMVSIINPRLMPFRGSVFLALTVLLLTLLAFLVLLYMLQ